METSINKPKHMILACGRFGKERHANFAHRVALSGRPRELMLCKVFTCFPLIVMGVWTNAFDYTKSNGKGGKKLREASEKR
jgi:hypothetical protein